MAAQLPATAPPLDRRLVDQALALLREEGLESLSLRRIARRAGVSHGAPQRHFDGLAGLLSQVAAHGFSLLSCAIEEGAGRLAPGSDPVARLAAAGRAYVEVAVANPALFALMFRPEDLDMQATDLARESKAAFEALLRHVRAAQDTGWQVGRDTRLLAGCVWAAVHGLAVLWAQGALSGPVPRASLDDAVATTLELVVGDRHGGPDV